ncbi:MAG TPA: tetratricopeptide repeat protein, partial [Polyangiaceae bacterium]|nr:tetratricopeptide repeat protein [Polyangiaceae bacterium]
PPPPPTLALGTGLAVALPQSEATGGIRPLTAAILVGLAALQGLLVVLVWRALVREPSEGAATAAPLAAPVSAAPQTRVSHAPAAALSPAPRRPAPPAPPVARGDVAFPAADGSGSNAPTCEELWAGDPPRTGSYPGAAFQQSRAANRWITRGDVEQAQRAYCLAVHWDAKNVGFLVGLGHLLLLRRDGVQAVPILKRALELNPDSARAHGLLGDALARTGDYQGARAHWLEASGYEPGDDKALKALGKGELHRGEEHLKRREWVHAERMFRRAVLSDPKSLPAVLGLSRSLTEQGEPKAAALWAKYAVSLNPRSVPARIELGDALAKQGDAAAAKVEYQEAQLLDPTDETARQRIRGEE